MYVAHVRLTKRYKHNKNENKIEFEEDSASDSGDFIRKGCLRVHIRWRKLFVVFSVIECSFPLKNGIPWDSWSLEHIEHQVGILS